MNVPLSATGGFDGTRLRRLQLERARSSLSTNNNEDGGDGSSPEAAFRRWSSMNDTVTTSKDPPQADSSSRLKAYGNQERVVYVLPDPQKGKPPIETAEHTAWKLKYPHGMPRWGPKSESSSASYQHTDSLKQTLNKDPAISKREDNDKARDSRDGRDAHKKKVPANSKKRQKQKDTVPNSVATAKAQEQSLLAATRAAQKKSPNHHGHKASSKMKNSKPPTTTSKTNRSGGLLGSRFLLGRKTQPSSLLESARIKQAHVMQTGAQQIHTVRQTTSLDDPLRHHNQHQSQQQKKNVTTRSVQSFEFLRYSTSNNETDSCHDSDDNDENIEEVDGDCNDDLSIDSEVEADDVESYADCEVISSNDDDDNDDDQSWSLQGGSEEDNEQVSIDDSIHTSSQSQPFDTSTSSDLAGTPSQSFDISTSTSDDLAGTPRGSSIPTVILSEVDPENSSRFSDYSSLAEFYDAQGSVCDQTIRTTLSASQTDRGFDAQRCRELLAMRNTFLEKDERRRLLSPQAEQRLATAPCLLKVGNESTLLELSTRSRWLERTQAIQYGDAGMRQSPTANSGISSPFSAMYPSGRVRQEPLASMLDEDTVVPPIDLVAPPTIHPAHAIRNQPWHVPKSETTPDDSNDEQTNSIPAIPFLSRVRLFILRCVPVLLHLLWAVRAKSLLQHRLTVEAVQLGICTGTDTESLKIFHPSQEVYSLNTTTHVPQRPGLTLFSNNDMPILLIAPAQPEQAFEPTDNESNLPQKCFAKITKDKLLEILKRTKKSVAIEPIETAVATNEAPSEESDPAEEMLLTCIIRNQTICDDIHGICCAPPVEAHEAPEIFESAFSREDRSKRAHPLKQWGDKLRKRGQKLLEQRVEALEASDIFESVFSRDDHNQRPHPLKQWGDKLRKRGQQLLEQRRHRREIYRV